MDAEGDVVASWNQVRHADLVDQFCSTTTSTTATGTSSAGTFADGLETWRVEVCANQELTDWVGRRRWILLGMNAEMTAFRDFSGARGELSPDELGAR